MKPSSGQISFFYSFMKPLIPRYIQHVLILPQSPPSPSHLITTCHPKKLSPLCVVHHTGSGIMDNNTVILSTTKAFQKNTWSTIIITIDSFILLMTLTVSGGVTIPTMSIPFPTPSQTTWPSVQVYASLVYGSQCSDPQYCHFFPFYTSF